METAPHLNICNGRTTTIMINLKALQSIIINPKLDVAFLLCILKYGFPRVKSALQNNKFLILAFTMEAFFQIESKCELSKSK